MDPFRLVVVRGWDDLDDFVAGKGEVGNVSGGAGEEVAVQDAEDGLVGDDEDIVLFPLELENDGFEADGQVVIGLLVVLEFS